MATFDALLETATDKRNPKIVGALMSCVDSKGNRIYHKTCGYDGIHEDAAPLRDDAVLKVASATKLIVSIALLQCIEKGLIGLDDSLHKLLPELDGLQVIQADPSAPDGLGYQPRTKNITARHLLTHTSGFGYHFIHPLLMKWAATPAHITSNFVTERFSTPLVFQPGAENGWQYGGSSDWAGVAVRRLHDTTLEEYLIEHVWKPVGRQAPFPTFHISQHPEYQARLMGSVERTPEGGVKETKFTFGDNPDDEEGGSGLALTMADYVAVLADLISDKPRLLTTRTIESMFVPQLPPDSPAIPMFIQLKPAWGLVAGPVPDEGVNHGLGGAVIQVPAPSISQPANILGWGGASNIVWFISREHGVAGFFGTQLLPFGDAKIHELVNAWKKDFWTSFLGTGSQ